MLRTKITMVLLPSLSHLILSMLIWCNMDFYTNHFPLTMQSFIHPINRMALQNDTIKSKTFNFTRLIFLACIVTENSIHWMLLQCTLHRACLCSMVVMMHCWDANYGFRGMTCTNRGPLFNCMKFSCTANIVLPTELIIMTHYLLQCILCNGIAILDK